MKTLVTLFVLWCVLNLRIKCEYQNNNYVEEVFRWKKIVYENLPKPENSWVGPYRYYIPENEDIGSIGYHSASGLMVVNMVRLRPGIPTSVGAFCVNDYKYLGSSPLIWGFPNYELNELIPSDFESYLEEGRKGSIYKPPKYNNGGHQNVLYKPIYQINEQPTIVEKPIDLKRIISVFHITADEKCNRLFFMDNGELQYYQNMTYPIQKPSLWVIDLPVDGCQSRNFQILRRVELPDRIVAKGSNGYMSVNLDYQSDDCNDLFLYITNAFSGFLTVYDYKKDEFWTFDHETMKPIIAESYFIFRNFFPFQMELGIFALNIGPKDEYGNSVAYYSSIANTAHYTVSTKILKDRKKSPENYKQDDFRIFGHRGFNHQPLSSVIDYTISVMFTTDVQTNEVHCWNINKPLNPDNTGVIYKNDKYFFGPEIILDSSGYLWFIASSIPLEFASDLPLDLTQVISRVFRVKAMDAIKGTICES
ncbi:L-dopachrome tautomerase yellow-f-like [Lutzomyia longipalpis]|uniref:L-dopachrome tautomerase yellow-f-like n=1 Tax=Lutzomyia longipalpis TaxID=7200 RepID=UPI002483976D|nr:L-dopachrome tautomerase yellow-f-like [Lutzomyia longipalpis]